MRKRGAGKHHACVVAVVPGRARASTWCMWKVSRRGPGLRLDLIAGHVQMLAGEPGGVSGLHRLRQGQAAFGVSRQQRLALSARCADDQRDAARRRRPRPITACLRRGGTPTRSSTRLSAEMVAAAKSLEFLDKLAEDRRRAKRHHAAGDGRRDRRRQRALEERGERHRAAQKPVARARRNWRSSRDTGAGAPPCEPKPANAIVTGLSQAQPAIRN